VETPVKADPVTGSDTAENLAFYEPTARIEIVRLTAPASSSRIRSRFAASAREKHLLDLSECLLQLGSSALLKRNLMLAARLFKRDRKEPAELLSFVDPLLKKTCSSQISDMFAHNVRISHER
jgi:hypothetical protein